MNTSVNNFTSGKLGGIPPRTESAPVKEPALKKSDSQKSLSGPGGLQANNHAKRDLDVSSRPRVNINDLRKTALLKHQRQEQNAEMVAARNQSTRALDGKVSADEKGSFLSALTSSPLFNKMRETNSGNENAIITETPPAADPVHSEGVDVPPKAQPTPPPPPPLPPKAGQGTPDEIKVDIDAPPLSESDSDDEVDIDAPPLSESDSDDEVDIDAPPLSESDSDDEVDVDMHLKANPGNHGIQEEIEVDMDAPPPPDDEPDDGHELGVTAHNGKFALPHGLFEHLQPDEQTNKLMQMQMQHQINANAVNELTVQNEMLATIRDVRAKIAEAYRKSFEAAAKAMVDGAGKG
ncbi:hypothetical protein [Acidovorax sp. SUPP3334]|uniref:hypothetical protein n=1 Tax=Acidovorax sp. SUPP3334 TaxID=2920881 RepID=UPI0023DE3891|nr:hypothetical protein [Acidovorax sp. SUPP3334]GKT20753.1 hypothetical protein AVHM3334_02270 [Acidovorax sp. SUPP3334]